MSASDQHDRLHLGFLTAIEIPERGYVAGLLVTNRFGRPLEFQCTTPVKPNRTQQILYGPTLVPYVMGELIGKTLVEKIGVKPQLILTDEQGVLELRPHVATPVVWFVDDTHHDRLAIGQHPVVVHPRYPSDREAVARFAETLAADANLREPLARVREALHETLKQAAPAAA